VDIGVVILPEERWPRAATMWQRAENLGFVHAWTYDHMSWRNLRDRPWFAMVPTLAAAATATESIRLGPLVASPNFRHPATFAKDLVALDDISSGRIIAGIGAGGTGYDATVLGGSAPTPAQRSQRFEEFVVAVDLFLREPAASYDGTMFSADEVRTHPGCVQQPRLPLALAATGPRGMATVARFGDYWVTTGNLTAEPRLPPAEGLASIRSQLALLDDACAKAERDPRSIRRLVLTGTLLDPALDSVESFIEGVETYAAAGFTDYVVHWPRADEPYEGDLKKFETIVTAALARR
jgi:alkanesulfonate monooxygenase SsuD/methylene tetrahydromethanopterin reductase-like flavin-dependent oxidoreductase (luciferase family)